ncbi:malto-oligosyltrehalose synthase [Nocardioides sp.]|uniref:malto-oligosyltrehalose synthase n=1 Tax=Nocardioides sp. TaxID=35761 RepID=UPI003D12D4D6
MGEGRTSKPVSTYRFQISKDFDLFEATRRLSYLHDLGVDWVYLSPLLAAEVGSNHGYDVVSHDRIDPDRGGAEGLAALSAEAKRLGMGVLVDIVPNHVGVASPHLNTWWWDLLQHGRSSVRADTFDVDWDAGGGRIRIPVAGDDDRSPTGGPIAHLSLADTPTGPELRYHDHRFPIAPGTADDGADPNTVHDRQHYEIVNWRVADSGLNYRRFFAVNTLAAVRVEDPAVFAESHVEIKRWFDEELVDGLRVDHPDGLRDPEGYLADLAEITGNAYVLVEKILEPGERLPATWSTEGTTGYDALAFIDRVLTDPAGQASLDALETRLGGARVDWHDLIHDTKRTGADPILNSVVQRITRELSVALDHSVVELDRRRGSVPHSVVEVDHSVAEVHDSVVEVHDSVVEVHDSVVELVETTAIADAVAELLACFPVYRSYLPGGREHLDEALALARSHRPELGTAFDTIAPILGDPASAAARRFQQTSGMVMAKGVEDCAFYRWSRLTSLNEVGGDPSVFATTPTVFHGWLADRQHEWPDAMTCLSTHDTKRGEDVRARITVLSETPLVWEAALDELLSLAPVPDAGFGSLLWQAIVGAWPAGTGAEPPPDLRARLHGYAEKAMREAGDRTTWTAPDESYENAVHAAVDAALDDPAVRQVLEELLAVVVAPGWSNALAAKLLGITMPGVPDVYQGSELWEQSLVDPDNRRPVDFDARAAHLAGVRRGEATPLSVSPDDTGAAKLALTYAALTLRRDRADLFTSYDPLSAEGSAADHALAFDRGGAVTVVTRLPLGLAAAGGWGDTVLRLPQGTWLEQVTGREYSGAVPLSVLLHDLPVALLAREDS